MFCPTMQRQQHAQQGFSRAFAPSQNANQSHNDSIQNDFNLQHMPSQNTSHSRGGIHAHRRGSSIVRGEGRVFGRGRAMSSHSPVNKLEQGMNESLYGSRNVSNPNQAQGIFTRQQKYSSRFKPNQGSSQKDSRASFIERSHKSPSTLKQSVSTGQQQNVSKPVFGSPQPFSMPQSAAFDFTCTPQKPGFGGAQQQQQQQNVFKPAFSASKKDARPSFNKPPFSMPRSAAFNFTFTLQKPGFGGEQQQQLVFGRPFSGGKASTLLGAAQHQPLFAGNARAVQQPITKPEYATKRSFNETDAENIAPTDPRKKQHIENQQQPKEAAFGKRTLNPQAVSFQPANTIGKQGLNPKASPFKPSKQSSYARINEIQKARRPVASDFFHLYEPVESTPQPDQHGANESRPETPKAPEAAADPISEQQRLETLMKRTAELKESARQSALQDKEEQERRQRALQEKLRLEEEQKIMALLEKKEQEKERRLKAEARWRRQQRLDFEEEQTVMALLDKEVQEKARRLEAEASKRRQEKLRLDEEQKEEQEKARRLEAEASKRLQEEVRKRKANEDRIKEIATVYKMKQNKMLKLIQEKSKPWLSRSRHNIEKRNASIAKRAEILRFSVKLHNNNPYSGFKIDNLYKRYKLRTPEIMQDRAKIALQSEKIAEEFNEYKNEEELLDYVWRKENFNGFAYREVAKKLYQPQIEGKHAWTHLISCDPTATNSINWFSHKFDLDGEYRRKTSRYEEVDISTKLVDSTEQLFPKLNNEVEAITFVLPEKRVENERHDNAFWQSQRKRLADLIQALSKERPDFQCPILVTYYSDDISDVHDTLYNIPELLDFKNEKAIMDYHVLLMRKESITTRICDEMFWLFEASVTC